MPLTVRPMSISEMSKCGKKLRISELLKYGIRQIVLSSQYVAAAAAKSLLSCPTLSDPIDGSPLGSAIPGILQARTLEWVAISFSNERKVKSESEVSQSYPTLLDPMDCSLPGSSVHGIFQARVLEWGAIAFSEYVATYALLCSIQFREEWIQQHTMEQINKTSDKSLSQRFLSLFLYIISSWIK